MDDYWKEQFAKWRAEALAQGLEPLTEAEHASLVRGLQDSSEGRIHDLGSFDDDQEDEDAKNSE